MTLFNNLLKVFEVFPPKAKMLLKKILKNITSEIFTKLYKHKYHIRALPQSVPLGSQGATLLTIALTASEAAILVSQFVDLRYVVIRVNSVPNS